MTSSGKFRADLRLFFKSRVFPLILLINALIWLASGYFLNHDRDLHLEEAAASARRMANLAALTIDSEYEKIDIALRMVVRDHLRYQNEGPITKRQWLDDLRALAPELIVLRAASAQGDILVLGRPNDGKTVNIADRPYFQSLKASADAGLQITEPVISRTTGVEVVVLARRLNGVNGEFAGVVVASIPTKFFHNLFQQITKGTASNEFVVMRDAAHALLILHANGEPKVGVDAKPSAAFIDAYTANPSQGEYHGISNLDGQPRIGGYRRSDKFGYFIQVNLERRVVLDEWLLGLQISIATLFLLLMLSLALGFVAGRSLRERLSQARILEQQQRLLDEAQRLGRVGAFSVALRTNQWDISDALADALGLNTTLSRNHEELLKLIHADDHVELFAQVRLAASNPEQVLNHTFRVIRPHDGQVLWVRTQGRVTRESDVRGPEMRGSIQDVTKEKLNEQRLLNSQKMVRQFLDNLPALAYIKDASLNLIMVNDAFKTMLDLDPETMIGRNSGESLVNFDSKSSNAQDRRVLASGQPESFIEEYGGYYFETVKFAIEQDDSRLLAGISLDITERRQMELALKLHLDAVSELNIKLVNAQNQLLQSEKMASIGQLAAGVAHEINNPIGFITANLGTLTNHIDNLLAIIDFFEGCSQHCSNVGRHEAFTALANDKELAYLREDLPVLLRESKDGAERIRLIVKNLKDFSRIDNEEWSLSDLHYCLDSTLTIVRNELKYKAVVEKHYGQLPAVYCLSAQINQVFMNLLVNAVQSIQEKGTITLTTGVIEATEGLMPQVWVAISDTGQGIKPEHLTRIFDPFFTTKPVGQGTGLGLSLSWSIVQKHGGTLTVESKVGVGTTFRLTLPVDNRSSQAEQSQTSDKPI